ncbi:MAG: permease [Armatimonadota bacterium]|nr:permease [Armatimonadota bacterium]
MPADLRSHIFAALIGAWDLVVHLAPYVLGGILIAALLSASAKGHRVPRFLSECRWWNLPIAAIMGAVSPACTFGTVPIIAEMLRRGADIGAAATFLVASSTLNPQMFVLTVGGLGTGFALTQVVCAIILAIFAGLLVRAMARRGANILSPDVSASNVGSTAGTKTWCTNGRGTWFTRFGRSVLDLAEFVGFYFVLGSIIAALVSEFVPPNLLISVLGEKKWWAVPVAAVSSVPLYVCGGAMIPFLAVAQKMGMAAGAVLAVLIAGPATRVTALSALNVIFQRKLVLGYVLLVLVYAMLVGWLIRNPLVPKGSLSP